VPLLACPAVPSHYVKALLGKPAVAPDKDRFQDFAIVLPWAPNEWFWYILRFIQL